MRTVGPFIFHHNEYGRCDNRIGLCVQPAPLTDKWKVFLGDEDLLDDAGEIALFDDEHAAMRAAVTHPDWCRMVP